MYDIKMLKAKKLAELIEIAEQIGIKELKGLKKQDIIDKIVGSASEEKSNDIKLEQRLPRIIIEIIDIIMEVIKIIKIKTSTKTTEIDIKNLTLSLMQ